MATDSNTSEATSRLRTFARARHLRVRSCELLDPNVDDTVMVRTSVAHLGVRITLGASASRFSLEVPIDSALVFSVNAPNRVLDIDRLADFWRSRQLSVYVGRISDIRLVQQWASNFDHRRSVQALRLDRDEAIHAYRNGVMFVLRGNRALDGRLLDRVVAVARALASSSVPEKNPLDLTPLPPELRPLVQAFMHLAEPDDEMRSELLERLSVSETSAIRSRLVPELPRINQYFDSLREPWPDAALTLADLAQLASEFAVTESEHLR